MIIEILFHLLPRQFYNLGIDCCDLIQLNISNNQNLKHVYKKKKKITKNSTECIKY